MSAALPVTKLAGLLVKTFAKPLSKRIKTDLGRYNAARKLLIEIGQASYKATSYMEIWSSGYRVKSIKSIDSEKAMKDGAEFVGEGFVLAVSASIVIYEYNRSAKSTAKKNEEKRERLKANQEILQAKLNALDVRLKAVEDLVKKQQQLEEESSLLTRVVPMAGTEKPKYIEPPKEQLVPIAEKNIDIHDDHSDSDISERDVKVPNSVLSPATPSIASANENHQKSWWKVW
mmetsp:Transcript_6379/g.15798  ORF Transcript_6379/g.15798 Transcript_6379/m.15798 type:complete len:231 (-) Transcript_6379:1253-1945(-)|eukprot:CAMPEP_0197174278 /NCGR_PEP_ID=MMETSP1423-20130617/869_1 /TAXON_ID=476441 /ORGANISM="Pseudo-nitzschia heimii, Strain UNC1101" /LENGTH=230 /DNA_ID=CAMNT_0042623189 /DNA_START=84 /DNA_END=776 /DNA_ORIENTATION=-